MQAPTTILLATVLLTISGAFAPGPLSLSAIIVGVRSGVLGGVFIALGHMLFELPYVLALLWFEENVVGAIKTAKNVMAVIAAAFILYFAYLTAKNATVESIDSMAEGRLLKLLKNAPYTRRTHPHSVQPILPTMVGFCRLSDNRGYGLKFASSSTHIHCTC